jgi:hypothetical protein
MEPVELAIFAAEVGRRFQFLVDLYRMEGPQGSHLPPAVRGAGA